MADKQRGDRIRDRREELHLTQPAVVELLEAAALALPETHDLHPSKAGKPPVTLRGFQSYEQGGGIIWEKAKLLAGVLRMDVQEMMSGEKATTPDPFPAAEAEASLPGVLAAIMAQLKEQTQVLNEVKGVLLDVKELLGKDEQTADRMAATSESLDAHVKRVETALRAAPEPRPVGKRKTAPTRSPRASS